jgi:hypothetical protein
MAYLVLHGGGPCAQMMAERCVKLNRRVCLCVSSPCECSWTGFTFGISTYGEPATKPSTPSCPSSVQSIGIVQPLRPAIEQVANRYCVVNTLRALKQQFATCSMTGRKGCNTAFDRYSCMRYSCLNLSIYVYRWIEYVNFICKSRNSCYYAFESALM